MGDNNGFSTWCLVVFKCSYGLPYFTKWSESIELICYFLKGCSFRLFNELSAPCLGFLVY